MTHAEDPPSDSGAAGRRRGGFARRWLVRLSLVLGGLVALPLLAVTTGVIWLKFSQPEYSGTRTVPSLLAPVRIVRDRDAVPHIFAATPTDAYAALGFVHAQDRLWQMELMRRIGAGRVSELVGVWVGEAPLTLDRAMRTLGLYRDASAAVAALSPPVRAAVEAYGRGVNAAIATRRAALPWPFQVLWYAPEPWQPADSLIWGRLMAVLLAGNAWTEWLRHRIAGGLGADGADGAHLLDLLFPGRAEHETVTLAATVTSGGGRVPAPAPVRSTDQRAGAVPQAGPLGVGRPRGASNAWVLGPSRTTTGGALLANDPHLGLRAPIQWYLARIETPGWRIAGATAPGVPLHILGQTSRDDGTGIAWGLTTTHADTQDLVIERVAPDQHPDRYLTPESWEPFRTRTETVGVRGARPVTVTVRATRHGPVISDLGLPGVADALGDDQILVLAAAALADGAAGTAGTAEALFRLNHAGTADQARAAVAAYRAPVQTLVYADRAGAIALATIGRIPIRADGDGLDPVAGWTGRADWHGFVPAAALPRLDNPTDGVLVTANNAVVGDGYPYLIAARWPPSYRADRLIAYLGETPRHSPDAMAALLTDAVSPAARRLVPLMRARVRENGRHPLAAAALERLDRWDGTMARDRAGPLIFVAWLRAFQAELFRDRLGPAFDAWWGLYPRIAERLLTESSRWCAADGCADALGRALDAALDDLADRYGNRVAAWQWGAAHRATLADPILSRLPVIGGLADIGVPVDGGPFTVNRGDIRVADDGAPFASRHGAGYRALYDLADPAASRFIIATGQGGDPLSPHFGDFVTRWQDGEMIRLDDERLTGGGVTEMRLVPDR